MSQSDQQAVIEFVNNIPVNVNPYSAVARLLINLLQPPSTPTWARWLERTFLLGFVIIFFQSCFLIYTCIKTKKFRACSIDELGLLNIDVHVVGVGFLVYSALVITDIILDEVFGNDYRYQGSKIMLFGCKFMVVLNCSWVFLWACVCQCASLKWFSSSHGRSFGHNMPTIVPWILHILLIILVLWLIPVVFLEYGKARAEYNQILDTVLAIVHSLRKTAATVTPETYNKYQLLLALMPAQKVAPLLDGVASSVRLGILAYLITMGVLSLAYIPFLVYSLRALYARGASEAFYVDTLVDASDAELLRFRLMSHQTQKEWNMVMLHAMIAYSGTLAHLPTIIWQMTVKGNAFLRDPTWQLVTRLGLHGPFAVLGIVSLFFLNRNAKMTSTDFKEDPQMTSSSIKPSREFMDREATLSVQPQTFSNATICLEMENSFGDLESIEENQELISGHTAHRHSRPRTCGAFSDEIIKKPDQARLRSASTSTRRKPVNMHGISP